MSGEDIDGIQVSDVTTSTGEEQTRASKSNSSTSSGSRSPVFIKQEYGTEVFGAESSCHFCGNRAEGVLRYKGELLGEESGLWKGWPLCKSHRRELEAMNRFDLSEHSYKIFEDDD